MGLHTSVPAVQPSVLIGEYRPRLLFVILPSLINTERILLSLSVSSFGTSRTAASSPNLRGTYPSEFIYDATFSFLFIIIPRFLTFLFYNKF